MGAFFMIVRNKENRMSTANNDGGQPNGCDRPTQDKIRTILLQLLDLVARKLAQEFCTKEQRDEVSENE